MLHNSLIEKTREKGGISSRYTQKMGRNMHSRKLSATSILLSSSILFGQLASTTVAFLPSGLPSGQSNPMSAASSGPLLSSNSLSTSTGAPSFSETRLSAANRVEAEKVNEGRPDWLPKLPSGCESDYECDGMESCCDFLLFKACCTDGKLTKGLFLLAPLRCLLCFEDKQEVRKGFYLDLFLCEWNHHHHHINHPGAPLFSFLTTGHSQADWVPVPIPVRPQDGYYGGGGGGGGYYR